MLAGPVGDPLSGGDAPADDHPLRAAWTPPAWDHCLDGPRAPETSGTTRTAGDPVPQPSPRAGPRGVVSRDVRVGDRDELLESWTPNASRNSRMAWVAGTGVLAWYSVLCGRWPL
jgi:hypothetical protein